MKHRRTGISKSPSVKPMAEKSKMLNVAAGSGARPHASATKIETSAPKHPHKLSRAPAGALK